MWPEFNKTRSQDLEKIYHDAGQWYWIKTEKFKNSLITSNTRGIILKNIEVQDIDNHEDWKIAEIKFKIINSL